VTRETSTLCSATVVKAKAIATAIAIVKRWVPLLHNVCKVKKNPDRVSGRRTTHRSAIRTMTRRMRCGRSGVGVMGEGRQRLFQEYAAAAISATAPSALRAIVASW
jgi:hypothetical protein